jgi:hypothetical protein
MVETGQHHENEKSTDKTNDNPNDKSQSITPVKDEETCNIEDSMENEQNQCIRSQIVPPCTSQSYMENTVLNHYILHPKIRNVVKYLIGNYYSLLHLCIAMLGAYVILFSNNVFYLMCVINVLAVDALTILILHDCPLTMLERYYIKHSTINWRLKSLRNCGIKYTLENEYDIQFEVIINSASLAIFKMFCLIALNPNQSMTFW